MVSKPKGQEYITTQNVTIIQLRWKSIGKRDAKMMMKKKLQQYRTLLLSNWEENQKGKGNKNDLEEKITAVQYKFYDTRNINF